MLRRILRFVVAWLPQEVKPPVPEWGAVVEVRYFQPLKALSGKSSFYSAGALANIKTGYFT